MKKVNEDKKELDQAFKALFLKKSSKNNKIAPQEKLGFTWNKDQLKKVSKNQDFNRRLTIPISREQELFLENMIYSVHQNRKQKDQRITKASLMRILINFLASFADEINFVEIKDEFALLQRIIDLFNDKIFSNTEIH